MPIRSPGFLLPFIRFILTGVAVMMISSTVEGQHKFRGSNLLLEGRVNYGFLANHHLFMKIFNSHFPAFELNLGKETFGEQRWQWMYGYPIIGVSYWYSHLGNSPLLGSSHAVFPYVNYPLVRNLKHEFNFRLGLGLAYLTKKFDRLDNYKYLAIGSHINALFQRVDKDTQLWHQHSIDEPGICIPAEQRKPLPCPEGLA